MQPIKNAATPIDKILVLHKDYCRMEQFCPPSHKTKPSMKSFAHASISFCSPLKSWAFIVAAALISTPLPHRLDFR